MIVLLSSLSTCSYDRCCLFSGAAEVLPYVDTDLKRIAARVVEKAKEILKSKLVNLLYSSTIFVMFWIFFLVFSICVQLRK